MDSIVWFSFAVYAVTTAITPGPNNILALNAVGNFGIKRSRPLLAGIYAGICCTMALCGIFSASLAQQMPVMLPVMKYVGCGYILWLAFHILRTKTSENGQETRPQLSFPQGFFLQFANVKTILYGVIVFTTYVLPYSSSALSVAGFTALISGICVAATSIWAAAGSLLSSLIKKYPKTINTTMALLLVYSAISLLMA